MDPDERLIDINGRPGRCIGLGMVNFRFDFYVQLRCIVNRAVHDERNERNGSILNQA